MRYIHLSSDSYILQTSKGPVTLTKKSFNFHKIKRLMQNNATEEEILPLLKIPKLPEGLFQAYVDNENKMYYINIVETSSEILSQTFWLNGNPAMLLPDSQNNVFMGVYASKQELIADWPEYAI